jgi:hypothetical protein
MTPPPSQSTSRPSGTLHQLADALGARVQAVPGVGASFVAACPCGQGGRIVARASRAGVPWPQSAPGWSCDGPCGHHAADLQLLELYVRRSGRDAA